MASSGWGEVDKIMDDKIIGSKMMGTTNHTKIHKRGEAQGGAWASQAGAEFSNPFTSKPARDCENTSPSRSASGPAFSRSLILQFSENRRINFYAENFGVGFRSNLYQHARRA